MKAVPANARPFITAAGLLMYFTESSVRSLLTRIGERFRGAEIFFDAIPPPLPGAPSSPSNDLPGFLRSIPHFEPVTVQTYADSFPNRIRFYWLLLKIPPVRRTFAGSLVHARVSPS